MKSNHKQLLRELNACADALEWCDDRDSEQAWNECERGDWMLWLAAKMGIDRSTIVAAADAAYPAESLKQSAQIVRQTIPWSIIKQAIDRVEKMNEYVSTIP